MNTTEAWVLHRDSGDVSGRKLGELCLEPYSFPEITAHEVLAEPLYGCWEANMTHAVRRTPVDVCRQRREERIVLGNAGVVRILEVGDAVKGSPGAPCCRSRRQRATRCASGRRSRCATSPRGRTGAWPTGAGTCRCPTRRCRLRSPV